MNVRALVDFLGEEKAIRTPIDLYELNEKGLPGHILLQVMDALELTTKVAADLLQVSPRTIERAKKESHLNKQLSDELIRIIDVYQRGLEVFDTRADFLRWFNTPKNYFKNKKPIELLSNTTGTNMVLDELGRIEHGILS